MNRRGFFGGLIAAPVAVKLAVETPVAAPQVKCRLCGGNHAETIERVVVSAGTSGVEPQVEQITSYCEKFPIVQPKVPLYVESNAPQAYALKSSYMDSCSGAFEWKQVR